MLVVNMERCAFWLLIGLVMFINACDKRKSMSNDKKLDSLFLGISMGMEKKAFYDYCWQKNKEKIFKHGPTNQSVEYRLATELMTPVSRKAVNGAKGFARVIAL